MYTEDWTFITALYFSVTSLAKIGFGDYVPRAHPPEIWARRVDKFDLGNCVEAVVEESTRTFNVKRTPIDVSSKPFCQPDRWDNTMRFFAKGRCKNLRVLGPMGPSVLARAPCSARSASAYQRTDFL